MLIEILAGFIAVCLIYNVFVFSLRTGPSVDTKDTNILSGFVDSSAVVNKMFNCSVPSASGYVSIAPSLNMGGGSQFSYSIWLYVGDPAAAQNRTIFLKGDPNFYDYDVANNITNSVTHVNGRVAICPQLSFGAQRMSFALSFNTTDKIIETLNIDNNKSTDSVLRHNLASMYTSRWLLLTMTFEDSKQVGEHENGLLVRFYLNDVLYVTRQYASTIKQNQGNLHMLPEGVAIPKCKIADLKYHNYALKPDKISALFASGPSTHNASVSETQTQSQTSTALDYSKTTMNVSDYNRTDIYNA